MDSIIGHNIIEYSHKITELTAQIQQCDDNIADTLNLVDNLKQKKSDLIKERDTVISVLKECLIQPISMVELDDDM